MVLKVLALIILLSYLIGIIISMEILLENRDPSKTLLWIMMFMIFPGIGIFFYVFSGRNIRKQKLFRAKTRSSKLSHRQLLYSMEALKEIVKNQQKMLEDGVLMGDEVSPIKERVVRLLFNIGQFPYTTNNELEIYKDGHEKFASLIKDMKEAKDHIHLEYFIVKDSQIAREIQAILIDKAKSGVEVRLLYDDFACWRLKIKRSFLKELKEAQALGTVTPYDLSTKGGSVARNTANAYLISAPGHYRIPLVYGNAIKNGENNPASYKTNNRGTYILRNFQDHAGQDITDPWIEKTNGGSNSGVDGAEVVWADAAGLVHLSSTPIVRDAVGNAYLDFTVPADNIQGGNAVVAVKKGNTVIWSWHLWFAPEDVLSTIPVTNKQGKVYNFTKETLGWTPTVWEGSSYDKDRMVKVGIEQTVANNGIKQFAVINLTQKAGCARLGSATFYQFGRKDAFPGVPNDGIKEGGITASKNDEMTIKNGIQNPGVFYPASDKLSERPTNNYSYYNLWSMDNTATGFNDNVVVKTVYDPCPAGFKMPASNAFTGFTENGKNGGNMNVDGTDDGETFQNNYGHNFWTNNQKNATIYFPVTGLREKFSAFLTIMDIGCYWLAIPSDAENACFMEFSGSEIKPLHKLDRHYGHSVRPVAE